MNRDGTVDARDLSELKNKLLFGFTDRQSLLAADFNGDGNADSNDMTSMIRFLTGRS